MHDGICFNERTEGRSITQRCVPGFHIARHCIPPGFKITLQTFLPPHYVAPQLFVIARNAGGMKYW
jgi:hypothetical protein